MCGNGRIDPGETCDPRSRCPDASTCQAVDACLVPTLSGDPSSCNSSCDLVPITTCISGDACCPGGCDNARDTDCSKSCGDGVVGASETCEPRSATQACPSSCDDGDACTTDIQTGSGAACNVVCTHMTIGAPRNGDGCCASGADATSDDDCASMCGNGVVEAGEHCDGNCVADCDDGDPCTNDSMVGSADSCDAECQHADTSGACLEVPSGWTLGTTVAEGGACPAGFGGSSQILRSGPSTTCSSGCACGPASTGSCSGRFTVGLQDGSTEGVNASSSGLSCHYATANQPVTTITASALTFACSGGSCGNCNPMGTSTPSVAWDASAKFCALGSDAISCTSGKKCPAGVAKRCLLAAGAKQCPVGFVAERSWFTGASMGSCTCGGCGLASGQDCSQAKWAFGYGVCPYVSITSGGSDINQFYTFSAAGGSGQYPTQVGVAHELKGSIMGSPTAGVCAVPSAVAIGTSVGTGPQTLCCQP